MIELGFLPAEAAFAAIWLLIRLAVWLKQKRIDWKREAVLLLMYVNLAVILRFTFFPMERVDGKVQPLLFDASRAYPFRINPIPYVRLSDYGFRRDLLLNVVGNVCMFIPSGVILPIVYRRLDRFWKVVGTGALISLCIEILQLPFFERASDIDDLIMNTAGVAVGYGVYTLLRKLRTRKK